VLGGVFDVDVRDPLVRWHDKTLKGYETFLGFVALHYPEAQTLTDWIYYSQLNQRDAIRCAVEHYRRSEFCTGSLIWQLNDCWPVQSWALMDSADQPKAAWFELRRLYATELVSLVVEGGEAHVWVVLDNAPPGSRLAGTLTFSAYSLLTGARLTELSADVNVASGERRAVLSANIAGLTRNATLLVAQLGELTATALLDEPKALKLPAPAALSVTISRGALHLTTTTPLVDLFLLDGGRSDCFGDNAITCPTPGRYRVEYRGSAAALSARSLAGDHAIQLGSEP
jgi:beta-mannosidase